MLTQLPLIDLSFLVSGLEGIGYILAYYFVLEFACC